MKDYEYLLGIKHYDDANVTFAPQSTPVESLLRTTCNLPGRAIGQ